MTVSTYVFRGFEYVVSMKVDDSHTLTVEVEDRLTADQWRGTFDGSYIEDMTHKTGNFKQFQVFVNMLESAIARTSDSVSLDLLTFSDLELLRQRKAGVGTKTIPGGNQAALGQKRYLIVTYTVEFDRIHYPLPLPYVGKPDPTFLQNKIREQVEEMRRLKQQSTKDFRIKELEKLRADYNALLAEKEAIENEYLTFRKEVKHTTEGAAAKEIRILKGIIKNLEEEMVKEKSKSQRQTSRRQKDYNQLLEEVEELRASERNLRVRLKSLTNELAVYKRRALQSPSLTNLNRDRSASRERVHNTRSTSKERPVLSAHRTRTFSSGSDHLAINEADTSAISARSRRSPSLNVSAGARMPRFDPTAYVKEREQREQGKKGNKVPSGNGIRTSAKKAHAAKVSPSLAPGRKSRDTSRVSRFGRSRSSSVESITSNGSRGGRAPGRSRILSDADGTSSEHETRRSSSSKRSRSKLGQHQRQRSLSAERCSNTRAVDSQQRSRRSNPYLNVSASHDSSLTSQRRSNPRHSPRDSPPSDRLAEISDIDARLQRIHELMKSGI